jgi:hypothetical protein
MVNTRVREANPKPFFDSEIFSNTQNSWFFDSDFFKYPGPMSITKFKYLPPN